MTVTETPCTHRLGYELTCVVVVKEGVQSAAVHVDILGLDNPETPTDFTVSFAVVVAARPKVGIVDLWVGCEGD